MNSTILLEYINSKHLCHINSFFNIRRKKKLYPHTWERERERERERDVWCDLRVIYVGI